MKIQHYKEHFQEEFRDAVEEIFGADNIVLAFIHGSAARDNWQPPTQSSKGSDIDVFVCVDELSEQQQQEFTNWYVQWHEKHDLQPGDRFPIELMTKTDLDNALERLPDITVQMAGNSHDTWDALAWSEYIARPTLEKFGRDPAVIDKITETCSSYTDSWGEHILDNLNTMHHQEMFHRTGKLFVPWGRELVDFLSRDDNIGLHYDDSQNRYIANDDATSHALVDALKSFSEERPLETITDAKTLHNLKRTYIIDVQDELHIDALAKFMADPESAVFHKDHQSTRILADFPEQWKSQLLNELSTQHNNYIFGDTFGHLIDWHSDFPDKRITNGIQSEPVLGAIRYPLVNDTYMELSNDWLKRQTAYRMLWKELADKTVFFNDEKIVVAEHGCGTGDNSALIAQGLQDYSDAPVEYHAGDTKRKHALWTEKRLQSVGADADVTWNDVYTLSANEISENLKLDDQEVDITFCEHSLYFTANDNDRLHQILHNVTSLEKKNGLFISVLTDESDLDKLRERSPDTVHSDKENVSRKPADNVRQALQELGMDVHDISINSRVTFPELSEDEWRSIATGYVTITNPSQYEHVNQAVHILEFARRPLEHMKKDGSLEAYVEQVKEAIHYYETLHPERNQLNISSVIQIAASPNSDKQFTDALAASVESVRSTLNSDKPSPILTNAQSHKIERVLPNLSQERI